MSAACDFVFAALLPFVSLFRAVFVVVVVVCFPVSISTDGHEWVQPVYWFSTRFGNRRTVHASLSAAVSAGRLSVHHSHVHACPRPSALNRC